MTKKRLDKYIFEVQKSGANSFSRQAALKKCGLSPAAFQAALAVLSKKGTIISPKKEFYVIVPPEYHRRPLPPSAYIDALMKKLEKPLLCRDIVSCSHIRSQSPTAHGVSGGH